MKKDFNLRFTYKFENGRAYYKELLFRPGDLVMVRDWGENYSTFKRAFNAFGFGKQRNHGFSFNKPVKIPYPKVFKFVSALEHCTDAGVIICHIRSIEGYNFVIGIEGLTPFKVYPLRKLKGETTTVEIKQLKY